MKKYVFMILLLLLSYFSAISVADLSLISGRIYYSKISGVQPTERWEGIIGFISTGYMDETNEPISKVKMDSPNSILMAFFAASNLLDGKHYVAFLPENVTFNLTKLKNITQEDLEENGIFNQTNFPVFFPNYYQVSDNPKNTFCCVNTTVVIGGVTFTAFMISLEKNVPYYLLKYEVNNTHSVPMLITPLGYYTGYDGNECNFEAILPVDKTYYIYVLSREPPIKLDVWIDGQKTTHFQQTALTYNLTIRATNLYTGAPIPNTTVVVFEENGRNIFLPKHLAGEVARGVSLVETDDEGYAQFIVAPTEYPALDDYSIGVAASKEGYILGRRINLTVDNANEIVFEKKHPTDESALVDNAKAAVNWMNQIINTMYLWANKYEKGFVHTLICYTNGTYYFINQSDWQPYDSIVLHTGAPNVIVLQIKNADGSIADGYYATIEESGGFLLFNPTLNTPIIKDKTRLDIFLQLNNTKSIIVTPTSYADANSTIKMSIHKPSGETIREITFEIDRNLSPGSGGTSFSDDMFKTTVNAMNSVGYSLYYSLN